MKASLQILAVLLFLSAGVSGQTVVKMTRYLYKPINVELRNERLEDALAVISKKGGFYFSYSSSLVPKDSLVSVSAGNMPVKDILDQLLRHRFDYRENGNYIILRPAFHKLSFTLEEIKSTDKTYLISGRITDERTGAALKDASVFEKRLLRSALTDKDGYFRLRFRGDHKLVMLSVSRENYRDTTLLFLSGISVSSGGYDDSTTAQAGASFNDLVERIGFGRFLVSSRQRIQSLNIPDFLANTPFQASLTPGLSSHGMFSPQVINKVSLNVLGGYTAGVNGVEVAGLFNINKSNVQHIQVAGLANMVGGSVQGVQTGGLVNNVLQQVSGVQVGGILNTVKDSVEGVQIAGVANNARHLKGVQVAGVMNWSRSDLRGVQVGLINAAKNHRGLQIGLINVADTSSGYSIGLINWVTKGYHKVSLSSDEVTNANLSLKTGNSKLYTMLLAGMNASGDAKAYTAGLGLGHDFVFSNNLSLSAELSTRYLYLGTFDEINLLNRFGTNLQVRLLKSLTLFAGPAYSVTNSSSTISAPGFKPEIVPANHHRFGNRRGWIGWSAGISVF